MKIVEQYLMCLCVMALKEAVVELKHGNQSDILEWKILS